MQSVKTIVPSIPAVDPEYDSMTVDQRLAIIREGFFSAVKMGAMARAMASLKREGRDYPEFHTDVADSLTRIAAGQLLPELASRYIAAKFKLLDRLKMLSLPDQQRVLDEKQEVVFMDNEGKTEVRMLAAHELDSPQQIAQVFNGQIHTVGRQTSILKQRIQHGTPKPNRPGKKKRIRSERDANKFYIGSACAPFSEVYAEIAYANAAPPIADEKATEKIGTGTLKPSQKKWLKTQAAQAGANVSMWDIVVQALMIRGMPR